MIKSSSVCVWGGGDLWVEAFLQILKNWVKSAHFGTILVTQPPPNAQKFLTKTILNMSVKRSDLWLLSIFEYAQRFCGIKTLFFFFLFFIKEGVNLP